jgi:hypothetical protein
MAGVELFSSSVSPGDRPPMTDPPMTDPRKLGDARHRPVAAVASPAAALLDEPRTLSIVPFANLWSVVLVVLVPGVAMVVGVRVAIHGNRMLGVLLALLNLPIVSFYGFLLLFFGLGGSR